MFLRVFGTAPDTGHLNGQPEEGILATLTKEQVIKGMQIARNIAGKYKDTGAHLDIVSAGYEAVVLAGRSWDAAQGPWIPWCIRYVKEYTRAERSKMASVVSTNYKTRPVEADASTLFVEEEGGGWEDATVDGGDLAAQIEARHDAAVRLQELTVVAERALRPQHKHLAAVLVCRRVLHAEIGGYELSNVAEATGTNRQAVHRAGQDVNAALDALLPANDTDDLV